MTIEKMGSKSSKPCHNLRNLRINLRNLRENDYTDVKEI